MRPFRALPRAVLLLSCLTLPAAPAVGQDSERLWGRVTLDNGDRHEGFIRWDRNEIGWVDILNGNKSISDDVYETWLELSEAGERPVRTLDVAGLPGVLE